jgi:hypothetical protein
LEKIRNSTGRGNLSFGIFFIAISIAVALASILGEIASFNKWPYYYDTIIWIGSFSIVFIALLYNKRNRIWTDLRNRMKNSIKWPLHAKILNAICWAGPFSAIALIPSFLPYLILAGIGFGNITTYFLLKRYKRVDRNNNDNGGYTGRGQFIVGLISLVAIPIVFEIYTTFAVKEDIVALLSRFSISFAYAVGGVYDIMIGKK